GPWLLAHLDRNGGDGAVLSPAARGVLGGAPALGRRDPRLPRAQCGAACGLGLPLRPGPAPPGRAGSRAGGADLRPAPGLRRIGGLDHGAEEHALDCPLPAFTAGLSALRPGAVAPVVRRCARTFLPR